MQLQEDIYTSGGVQTHTLPPSVKRQTTADNLLHKDRKEKR